MEIKFFKTKEECSKFASEIIVNEIKKKSNIVLGLATGSTPEILYTNLVNEYKENHISFKDIITFNLDEYVGLRDLDKKQSYRFFMDSNLFNDIDIKKENTHFPINFLDKATKKDYSEYDALIESFGGVDIQILGLGVNGHIAFNEPGSEINSKTRLISLTESTIKANSRFFEKEDYVPKEAVTMGIATILKSKKIILLAFGQQKKEALAKLKNANSFDKNWPCTALWNHNDILIVTDIEL